MSLCWFVSVRKPNEGCEAEFYTLFDERSDITQKPWGLSDEEKARLDEIDTHLKAISHEAVIPGKWKRNGADSWMGANLTYCEDVLWGCDELISVLPYQDHTPEGALDFARKLKERVREWMADNPGWWKRNDISARTKEQVRMVESAIRYLKRWGERGYCIESSW